MELRKPIHESISNATQATNMRIVRHGRVPLQCHQNCIRSTQHRSVSHPTVRMTAHTHLTTLQAVGHLVLAKAAEILRASGPLVITAAWPKRALVSPATTHLTAGSLKQQHCSMHLHCVICGA